MHTFSEIFNDMLVAVYHKIMRVEEESLQKSVGAGLTIREMHLIEYVGKAGTEGRTLGEIAGFLEVARPSVTVSARKLEGKGLLIKNGEEQDGRVIRVTLTREGRRVFMHHMRFHTLMVQELENGFSEEEKEILIRLIEKLNKYFEKSIEAKL